jgi:cytochrome c oxidase subunit IV
MKYAYLIGAFVGAGLFSGMTIYVARSRPGAALMQKHPWVSYLLIWPIVLSPNTGRRLGGLFTRREWLGWGLVAILITCGVLFFSYANGA